MPRRSEPTPSEDPSSAELLACDRFVECTLLLHLECIIEAIGDKIAHKKQSETRPGRSHIDKKERLLAEKHSPQLASMHSEIGSTTACIRPIPQDMRHFVCTMRVKLAERCVSSSFDSILTLTEQESEEDSYHGDSC